MFYIHNDYKSKYVHTVYISKNIDVEIIGMLHIDNRNDTQAVIEALEEKYGHKAYQVWPHNLTYHMIRKPFIFVEGVELSTVEILALAKREVALICSKRNLYPLSNIIHNTFCNALLTSLHTSFRRHKEDNTQYFLYSIDIKPPEKIKKKPNQKKRQKFNEKSGYIPKCHLTKLRMYIQQSMIYQLRKRGIYGNPAFSTLSNGVCRSEKAIHLFAEELTNILDIHISVVSKHVVAINLAALSSLLPYMSAWYKKGGNPRRIANLVRKITKIRK